MKKVLQIVGYYPPAMGGIEDVCYGTVSNTKDTYLTKIICYNHESNKTVTDLYEGVEVTRVGIYGKLFKRQPITFKYYKELKKIIKTFRPDIIHFHAPNPLPTILLLLLRLKGIKLIVYWHADATEKLLIPIIHSLHYLLLGKADIILVATPYHLTGVKPLLKYQNKIKVVPYVIIESKFQLNDSISDEVESIKKRYNNKKIVFFIGRHVFYKGINHLIEAANYLTNDCVILIGGSGRLTESLKASVNNNKINFIGRISDNELTAYLYAADVFAFPSINKGEAFGMALAEALYCYTPAVTFTIASGSGVNWVSMKNETGFEVENGNSVEFAKAIDKLLSDDELRIKLGQQAHDRIVTNLLPKQFVEKIKEIYDEK